MMYGVAANRTQKTTGTVNYLLEMICMVMNSKKHLSVFNEYSTDVNVVVKKLAPASNSQRNEN